MNDRLLALDGALGPLREAVHPARALDRPGTELAPGLWLHTDPEADLAGSWESPRGRLVDLHVDLTGPGRWLGLHLALPPFEADALTWLSVVLRVHAARPLAVRPCLRSGTGTGFVDTFFDRHILALAAERDDHGLLTLARHPDLPVEAPWRELVLFLPPGESLSVAIHDLRVTGL